MSANLTKKCNGKKKQVLIEHMKCKRCTYQIAACKSGMVLKADSAGHVLRGLAVGSRTSSTISSSIPTNLPAKSGPQTSGAEFGQAELYSATLYDSDASTSPIGLGQETASVPGTQ